MIKTYYWSCIPGKFVNKITGEAVSLGSPLSTGPLFTGTAEEWNATLVETCVDMSERLAGNDKGLTKKRIKLLSSQKVLDIFVSSTLFKSAEDLGYDLEGRTGRPPSDIGYDLEGFCGQLSCWFNVYRSVEGGDTIVIENNGLVGEVIVLDLEEQK